MKPRLSVQRFTTTKMYTFKPLCGVGAKLLLIAASEAWSNLLIALLIMLAAWLHSCWLGAFSLKHETNVIKTVFLFRVLQYVLKENWLEISES